jgi:predicted DNA-binding transcriptional regulator AlpA
VQGWRLTAEGWLRHGYNLLTMPKMLLVLAFKRSLLYGVVNPILM